jgi:PPK2 family polyphosphate:nucleotide phosphotransferase
MNLSKYEVSGKQKIDLKNFPTRVDEDAEKAEIRDKLMPRNIKEMAVLQEKLFAQNRYALLILLQAMDAAGKDGIIRHVMTGLNPQGTRVVSFKVPSSEENDYGYLWRINKALPRRGEVGIFNRSHYEDVLVARVHDLVNNSQIPQEFVTDKIWDQRYRQIRDFEQYLEENGTIVIKIFLHVSREEQRQRLLDRIREPDKNWKFSSGDIAERKHWDEYQKVYELMVENTADNQAPWYIVPADDKWFARFLVSEIVLKALKNIDPQIPELPEDERAVLEECRRILEEDE